MDTRKPTVTSLERGREVQGAATIIDLELVDGAGSRSQAFLVVPSGATGCPAVVYSHWYARAPNANRTQFVSEGVALADDGIASLHVQGQFPWLDEPSGAGHDRAGLLGQVLRFRQALDLTVDRPEIDPMRILWVGHDFGAMYGALLARADRRIRGLVMIAPVPHWADWFAQYWDVVDALGASAYRQRLADLDPIAALGEAAPRPVLFQFALNDRFVSAAQAEALSAAAAEPKLVCTYDMEHDLASPEVQADRMEWLKSTIGGL